MSYSVAIRFCAAGLYSFLDCRYFRVISGEHEEEPVHQNAVTARGTLGEGGDAGEAQVVPRFEGGV